MGVKCDREDRAGRASHTEPLWSRVKLGGADVMCGQNGTLRHRNGNTLHFHDDAILRRIDLGMAFASKYFLEENHGAYGATNVLSSVRQTRNRNFSIQNLGFDINLKVI